MTRILYSPKALSDIERVAEFLIEANPAAALATSRLISGGMAVLAFHPLIGGRVESGLRELIISRGKSGYVALYRYDVAADEALVLGIRHQREVGLL